jgi:hypothetical protein
VFIVTVAGLNPVSKIAPGLEYSVSSTTVVTKFSSILFSVSETTS